jgi:hypothetical protein
VSSWREKIAILNDGVFLTSRLQMPEIIHLKLTNMLCRSYSEVLNISPRKTLTLQISETSACNVMKSGLPQQDNELRDRRHGTQPLNASANSEMTFAQNDVFRTALHLIDKYTCVTSLVHNIVDIYIDYFCGGCSNGSLFKSGKMQTGPTRRQKIYKRQPNNRP